MARRGMRHDDHVRQTCPAHKQTPEHSYSSLNFGRLERLLMWSFWYAELMRCYTVFSESFTCTAISRLVQPRLARPTIVISEAESVAT